MHTPLSHVHRTATLRASCDASFYVIIAMNIIIVLINWLFKSTMRASDQKLAND